MRGGLTATLLRDPLQAAADARLDARLDRSSAAPVALGLSGGGDSRALLHLAADWCARARRPLLALTVDHGVHPESPAWTAAASRMAAEAGVGWRALAWTGPKPSTGLPAAARAARHALLADAAREAGAAVVLLAHTADDHAETEALRAGEAPGIGRLREWSPSPAWPEGRGVFLLRPLLDAGRSELRAWLRARGLAWLEDPANADPRFARARLRAAGVPPRPAVAEPPDPAFGRALADGCVLLLLGRLREGGAAVRRTLSAAVACASGVVAAPRGRALTAWLDRWAGDDCSATSTTAITATTATSTIGGARLMGEGATVRVGRDLGRAPPPDLRLSPGVSAVWDGRFEAAAAEPGWSVGAARGRLARLSPSDRAALAALPPALRGAHPVLIRGAEVRLAPEVVKLRPLIPARFDAAVGRVRREVEIAGG